MKKFMKYILSILLCFGFLISCKEKNKPKESTPEDWAKVQNDYPKDTIIHQDIWYYKGQYVLQTWVQTMNQQTHLSQHKDFQVYLPNDSNAPYNVEIAGTFDYIKNNKIQQYLKADSFVRKISADALLQKRIADSIHILENIKTVN